MNERDLAENILKEICSKGITTTKVKIECKVNNVNYNMVSAFLKEHTDIKSGRGDYDILVLKDGSANFVFKGCWSGEEKRNKEWEKKQLKENSKNRRNVIFAAVLGVVVGLLLPKWIDFIANHFYLS